MPKKRKGFTWTRKKAWAICQGRRVVVDNSLKGASAVLLCGSKGAAEVTVEEELGETVRPCEIIVKVKGD